MTLVKVIWAANFFFFALILLYVWSKIYIISKKVQSTASVLEKVQVLAEQLDPASAANAAKTSSSRVRP